MVLANGSARESYQINRFDSFHFHLAGAFESRQRFEGAREATILTALLAARSAEDHVDWQGSAEEIVGFHRALIRHHQKRIAVANRHLRRLFSWSGGSTLDGPQPQTKELRTSHWYATQDGA